MLVIKIQKLKWKSWRSGKLEKRAFLLKTKFSTRFISRRLRRMLKLRNFSISNCFDAFSIRGSYGILNQHVGCVYIKKNARVSFCKLWHALWTSTSSNHSFAFLCFSFHHKIKKYHHRSTCFHLLATHLLLSPSIILTYVSKRVAKSSFTLSLLSLYRIKLFAIALCDVIKFIYWENFD